MKFTEDLKTFTIQRIVIIIMPTGTRYGSGIIYTFKASRCLADESVHDDLRTTKCKAQIKQNNFSSNNLKSSPEGHFGKMPGLKLKKMLKIGYRLS